CFEVLDFEDIKDKEVNNHAIMKPHNRLWLIQGFKKEYFRSINFGSSKLKLADNPLELEQTVFEFPSFELGNGEILSPNDFKGDGIPFKLAKERMKKICDTQVGFYSSTVLPNQFIALPRSVSDSMGKAFV